MTTGRFLILVGGIFGLVGLVMLGAGVAWAVSAAAFQAEDAQTVTFWSTYLGPMIVGGMGIVFTAFGAVLFVKGRREQRQREWLLENGREVWAEIADIGVDFGVEIHGRHPYVVHARWYDESSGRTHTATSDYLRNDPGPDLVDRTHVRVLYDPTDPHRNLVDLDALRNL
jgi:hypothetical protein